MPPRLPPLNALRAFEAAARHGGFIAAAEELNVTRGAISGHVKNLEDRIGTPLFDRHARGVELNAAGRALLPVLTDAFSRIADGVERISRTEADLRIICPPATSLRWLHPRLGDFRARHPGIRIQITTDYYDRGGFDRSRFNLGFSVEHWDRPRDDVVVEPLFPLVITPACAPDLAARLRTPDDLRTVTLLHERHDSSDWTIWLGAFPIPGLDPSKGDVYHNLDMATRAAVQGHGVVMSDLVLCREELERGDLVRPFPEMTCETEFGRFALLGNRTTWDDPAVAAFRTWAVAQAAEDTCALTALGWPPA